VASLISIADYTWCYVGRRLGVMLRLINHFARLALPLSYHCYEWSPSLLIDTVDSISLLKDRVSARVMIPVHPTLSFAAGCYLLGERTVYGFGTLYNGRWICLDRIRRPMAVRSLKSEMRIQSPYKK
jgi:hypothetical protein